MNEQAIKAYNELFTGVPLWSGDTWKSLSVAELEAIHLAALEAMLEQYQAEREAAIALHAQRWHITQWVSELFGWEAPVVPERNVLLAEMAQRCQELSSWASGAQHMRFYMDSDMSYLIQKPAAVAARLRSLIK